MHSCTIVLAAALLITYAGGFIFNRSGKWDGLKVTWGPNPLSKSTFASLPRTVSDATKQGYKKISGCEDHKEFKGNRYVKDGDTAVILLFDKNGYIAGIQAGVDTNSFPYSEIQPPFLSVNNHHFITAYFVNPATICSHGRSSSDFDSQGTGTDLYIQTGLNPIQDLMKIPHAETSVTHGSKWVKGKCFPTMGVHYWHDLHKDSNCHKFLPVFLLYNKGKLNAFGWAFIADLKSSRYEHPDDTVFTAFMNDVPTCLKTSGVISTMHIYLTEHPTLDLC